MSSIAITDPASVAPIATRRVLLIWQDPGTRLFLKVGCLEDLGSDGYSFRYLDSVRTHPGFAPIAQFPALDQEYRTAALPEFFANRVMSKRRENYGEYLSWLGLEAPAEPVEILVRTGGSRATDTFHIVDDLFADVDGIVRTKFFASGNRHLVGAVEHLRMVSVGQRLIVREDPGNPQNSKALLLDVRHGNPVGYVPNWLVDDVHQLLEKDAGLAIFADSVNAEAPAHLRLLCRLEARP